jgi:hypothetical protein
MLLSLNHKLCPQQRRVDGEHTRTLTGPFQMITIHRPPSASGTARSNANPKSARSQRPRACVCEVCIVLAHSLHICRARQPYPS